MRPSAARSIYRHVRRPRCQLALFFVLTLPILLTGCVSTARPESTQRPSESRTTRNTEFLATPAMMHAGPLQSVLPDLAARAIARDEVLVIPGGTYAVTESVILPPGARVRLAQNAVLAGDLPGRPVLRLAARSSLSGGVLHNTSTSPGFDLDLAQDAQHIAVEGVNFHGASSNALYMAAPGISDVRIIGNRFEQVGYGVLLNPPAIDARGITIQRNVFVNACGDAVEINAATGGGLQRVRDVEVSDNRISGSCGDGPDSGLSIGLAGVDGFLVTRNAVLGARNEAVHLEDGTTNGSVTSNRVRGGGHGDRPAIAIYRTTSRIRVADNTIEDFDGGGIGVRWDSYGSARSVTIELNRLQDIVGDAIVVSGGEGTGPFTVERNDLRSISGNGIAVVGPHEQTTVRANRMQAVAGQAILQVQRGSGTTDIENNIVE